MIKVQNGFQLFFFYIIVPYFMYIIYNTLIIFCVEIYVKYSLSSKKVELLSQIATYLTHSLAQHQNWKYQR